MPLCPTCKVNSLRRQSSGLLKCQFCGFTFKPGQSTPLTSKYAPVSTNMQNVADQEIETYITRLMGKLLPIYKDYPDHTKNALLIQRQKLRDGFNRVLDGKQTFQKWFDHVHTSIGKHPLELAKILYECTEGLNSKEAKEFANGCQEYYKYISNKYDVNKDPRSFT